MKLRLIEKKNMNDKDVKIYEIGRYTVKEVTYENGCKNVEVRRRAGGYTPEIYCRDNLEGEVLGFEVQTTSYGSLQADEIRKLIIVMEEAAQAAEILTAEFVK